jgi:hypothetical protein
MAGRERCGCVRGQLLLGWLLLATATPTVPTSETAEPAVVGWDGQWLQTLRQEVASARGIRPPLRPALTALRSSAHSLLSLEAPSVVTAGSVPLPGTGVSPHDMWYLATYAWPCGVACNLSYFNDCSHWWQPPLPEERKLKGNIPTLQARSLHQPDQGSPYRWTYEMRLVMALAQVLKFAR